MSDHFRNAAIERIATRITRDLMDQGKVMSAGWQLYRFASNADQLPIPEQDRLREAYFMGAQHVWASVLSGLDPDHEVTDRDIAVMDKLNDELAEFHDQARLKYLAPKGSG